MSSLPRRTRLACPALRRARLPADVQRPADDEVVDPGLSSGVVPQGSDGYGFCRRRNQMARTPPSTAMTMVAITISVGPMSSSFVYSNRSGCHNLSASMRQWRAREESAIGSAVRLSPSRSAGPTVPDWRPVIEGCVVRLRECSGMSLEGRGRPKTSSSGAMRRRSSRRRLRRAVGWHPAHACSPP